MHTRFALILIVLAGCIRAQDIDAEYAAALKDADAAKGTLAQAEARLLRLAKLKNSKTVTLADGRKVQARLIVHVGDEVVVTTADDMRETFKKADVAKIEEPKERVPEPVLYGSKEEMLNILVQQKARALVDEGHRALEAGRSAEAMKYYAEANRWVPGIAPTKQPSSAETARAQREAELTRQAQRNFERNFAPRNQQRTGD